MGLTSKQIGLLKKANVSVDSEKTKERIINDFKATSKSQEEEILALSGLSVSAFYNVGKTGAASPKVVLSLAQVLDVSPFYYTGEIDEKSSCTDKEINRFFKKYRNKKLNAINEPNINTPPEGELKSDAVDIKPETDQESALKTDRFTTTFSVDLSNSDKMNDAIRNLDEETAGFLLKSLLRRAEAGGTAEALCNIVKRCLLL